MRNAMKRPASLIEQNRKKLRLIDTEIHSNSSNSNYEINREERHSILNGNFNRNLNDNFHEETTVPKPSLEHLIRILIIEDSFEFFIPTNHLNTRDRYSEQAYINFTLPMESELIIFVKTLERFVHFNSILFFKERDMLILSELQRNIWEKKDLKIIINNSITMVVDFNNKMLHEGINFVDKHIYHKGLNYLIESIRRFPNNEEALFLLIKTSFKLDLIEKSLHYSKDYSNLNYNKYHDKVLFYQMLGFILLGCQNFNLAVDIEENRNLLLYSSNYITQADMNLELRESDSKYFKQDSSKEFFISCIIFFKKAILSFLKLKEIDIPIIILNLIQFIIIFLHYFGRSYELCPFCLKNRSLSLSKHITNSYLKIKLLYIDKLSKKYKDFGDTFYNFSKILQSSGGMIIEYCKDCLKEI